MVEAFNEEQRECWMWHFDCSARLSGIRPHCISIFPFVWMILCATCVLVPPRMSICLFGAKLG